MEEKNVQKKYFINDSSDDDDEVRDRFESAAQYIYACIDASAPKIQSHTCREHDFIVVFAFVLLLHTRFTLTVFENSL